ncbi:MAG: hypothetical protein ABSD59_04570 [Terracidiphilus sp.]|jgi:hypothetical protein
MTDPRSWNRREFDVAQAGYFNVLRPTRWFSAVRLPGGFRYRLKGAEPENPAMAATLPPAPGSLSSPKLDLAHHAVGQGTAIPPQFALLGTERIRLVLPVSIVLVAIAIMYCMVVWIGNS